MNDDATLLRRYAEEKSEAAFAALVGRHLDLVYSAAQRRLGGDAHRAADVAQQVFTTLARDAARLSRHTVLTAWLYTATRNAATDVIRTEQRRRTREQEAHLMHPLPASSEPDPEWEKICPVLETAMDELAEADRAAVLLRYFERRPFAEIGAALHLSEDAARMRVERALEKLRTLLARRGITSATAALGAVLTGQAAAAAPAGLAGTVTGAALVGAGVGGAVVATGIFMKTSMAVLGGAALVALTVAIYQTGQTQRTRDELAMLARERDALRVQATAPRGPDESTARKIATLQKELERARISGATTAAPAPQLSVGSPEADAPAGGPEAGPAVFLMRTSDNPAEAKRQARARYGANVDSAYAALYRKLG